VGEKSPKPELEALKAFSEIRRVIAREMQDPFGKVNAYGGMVLLVLVVLAVLNYLAGSVGAEIHTRWFSADLSQAGVTDLLLVFGLLAGFVFYWLACMKTFIQLEPHFRKRESDD
jgi:hypothetical protein